MTFWKPLFRSKEPPKESKPKIGEPVVTQTRLLCKAIGCSQPRIVWSVFCDQHHKQNLSGKSFPLKKLTTDEVGNERDEKDRRSQSVTACAVPTAISLRMEAHPAHGLVKQLEEFKIRQGECEEADRREYLALLDQAIALAPDDVDLLYAKACMDRKNEVKHLEQLRRLHPDHLDTIMTRGEHPRWHNRPLPADWEGLYQFPGWSQGSAELKGFMLQRVAKSRHVQIVRHQLGLTLAMVYGSEDEDYFAKIGRLRWDLKWARTPFGPIAAHYLIWTLPGGDSGRNEGFLPHRISNPPSALDGYCLLQRLARVDYCFVVFASGTGKVLRNEVFSFPESLKRNLGTIRRQLDENGPSFPYEAADKACKWYMNNTDVKDVTF